MIVATYWHSTHGAELTLASSYRENVFLHSRLRSRIPTVATTDPGLRCHPSQSIRTFLAKISPNPSITPFTKGSSKLTAREEKKAVNRVRLESDASKIAKVSDTGPGWWWRSWGDLCSSWSGNDIEGKDDLTEGTSSHFCDSSVAVLSCRESGLSMTGPTCVDEEVIWGK